MADLVIIGAGGFGREILDVFDSAGPDGMETGRRRFLGFVDDGAPDASRVDALGERLLGRVEDLDGNARYLIGIGSPTIRAEVDGRAPGEAWSVLRHATVSIGRCASLAPGTVLCAQSTITTNVQAGLHLHLNLGSTVGHDCVLGDYVTVAPGVNISGNVTVGDRVEFGTGSKVLPGITIGADAVIGAGAVVTRDVPPGVTAKGVPARW